MSRGTSDSLKTESTTTKRKPYERFWSERDELKILEGVVEYHNTKGIDPASTVNMDALYAFMKSFMGFEFTKNQLGDKIRRMRREFRRLHESTITKPHEAAKYELSKRIWGEKKSSIDEDEDAEGESSNNDRRLLQVEQGIETLKKTYEKNDQQRKAELKELEKQLSILQSLKLRNEPGEKEVISSQKKWKEKFIDADLKLKVLTAEHMKLLDEVEKLKGTARSNKEGKDVRELMEQGTLGNLHQSSFSRTQVGDADSEDRLSAISENVPSVGTETDTDVEFTLFPEFKITKVQSRVPTPLQQKKGQTPSVQPKLNPLKSPIAMASVRKGATTQASTSAGKSLKRWW